MAGKLSFLFRDPSNFGARVETECGNWSQRPPGVTRETQEEPRARFREASYFLLLFFVVFFAEDFLVVDFLAAFLAAMALVTSFLMENVKLENFSVNDFLLANNFFSALRSRPRVVIARRRRGKMRPRRARTNGKEARRRILFRDLSLTVDPSDPQARIRLCDVIAVRLRARFVPSEIASPSAAVAFQF